MAKTMSVRHIVTLDGLSSDKSIDVSGAMQVLVDGEAIAGSATTQLFVPLDVSAVVGFAIVSTVATTLKTNSSGSPDNTLALVANQPYIWHTGAYDTFKLTTDVVSMYFVVAGATAGTVTIAALIDPTP